MWKKSIKSYISIAAVKNIQRTVIICSFQIIHVVFHFHFDGISFIVFATFELLVTIFFGHSIYCPLVGCGPLGLSSTNNHGYIRLFIALNKLFGVDIFYMNSFNCVINFVKWQIIILRKSFLAPRFSRAQFWNENK